MQIPLIDNMYTVQEGIIQKCVWNLTPDRCVHLWQSFIENSRNDFMSVTRGNPQPHSKALHSCCLCWWIPDGHLLSVVSPLLRLSPREESSERETVCYRWLEKLDTHRFKREWTVWTELTSIYKTNFQPGLGGKHEVITKRQIVHVRWHKTQFFYFGQHDFLMRVNGKYIFCLGHMYILPVNVSLHLSTDGVKDVVFLCCCISIRIGNPFSWASGIPVVSLGEIKWPKNHRWGVTAKQRSAEIKVWDTVGFMKAAACRFRPPEKWQRDVNSSSKISESVASQQLRSHSVSFFPSFNTTTTHGSRPRPGMTSTVRGAHWTAGSCTVSSNTSNCPTPASSSTTWWEMYTSCCSHVLHCQFDQSFPTNQIPVLSDMCLR